MGQIRTGVGGWVHKPWRGTFYPPGLRQADELTHMSGRLSVVEVNSTFQSFQTPATFAGWAARTPENFVFCIKAHRICVNRRVLAGAGESIETFLGQGLTALGPRLGPILWQFMPTKAFDPADMAAFLDLLPPERDGVRLRHAVEVRHDSFANPAFADLCRSRKIAVCLADHPHHPLIEAPAPDFAYARLMRGRDDVATGYAPEVLDAWAARLTRLADEGRDVFAFFIKNGKLRAPAAAEALVARIGATST